MHGWLVRAVGGRWFDQFLEAGFVAIRGGDETSWVVSDLSGAEEPDIRRYVSDLGLHGNYARMLTDMVLRMRIGDEVAVPSGSEPDSVIAIGRLDSDYEFLGAAQRLPHSRRVEWTEKVARSSVPGDFWKGRLAAVTSYAPSELRSPVPS